MSEAAIDLSTRPTDDVLSEAMEGRDVRFLPSILTVSAREITEYFENQAIRLEASASRKEKEKETVNGRYSVYSERTVGPRVTWSYEQNTSVETAEVTNPLDDDGREEVWSDIDSMLPNYEDPQTGEMYEPDMSVEGLTVLVDDEELADITGSETATFRLRFEGDKLSATGESDLRGAVRERNKGRRATHQGFKLMNLNLHSLVEQYQYLNDEVSEENHVQWDGPGSHVLPKVDMKVSTRVMNHLPTAYQCLKEYELADETDVVSMTRAWVGGGQ